MALRDRLVHLLTEAAEIEHNLLCSYLYAAFSLKRGPADGLSATELEAMGRWRKVVMGVAIEEMAHLALVNNVLVALGARPSLHPAQPERAGRRAFPAHGGGGHTRRRGQDRIATHQRAAAQRNGQRQS